MPANVVQYAGTIKLEQVGRIALVYLFQNSTQFGRELDNVDVFYSSGVRSSQITYNYQNWAGAGCNEFNGSGLTLFGHELVGKMNEVGMLIDPSHANMRTMADTIAVLNFLSSCQGPTQSKNLVLRELD